MAIRLLIILTISTLYPNFLLAKKNCKISLVIDAPTQKGEYIKLGHYYGLKTLLIDSLHVASDGSAIFSDSINPGIYLVNTLSGTSYEFMVAETGILSILLPDDLNQNRFEISGNMISEGFNSYLKETSKLRTRIDTLKNQLKNLNDYKERIAIQRFVSTLRDSLDIITGSYVKDYSGTLLGNYLKALLPVEMPQIKIPQQVANPDSFRWVKSHNYFRNHYLENVNLDDPGLIYTPVLEDKVVVYLTRIIEQNPESVTSAIDALLFSINENEVSQFLTELLIEKYGSAKHKPVDEYVYLYLIKSYYLSGRTPWASNRNIRLLTDEYNRCKPASLYQKAPPISLPDEYNAIRSLADVQAKYSVLIFWDYECPHCLRAMEDIRKVLNNYSDETHVFSVFTGKDTDVWNAFLARKIPGHWTNTHLNKNNTVVKQYNISQTPSIFLLDEGKIILNKNMTASVLDSYLEDKLK